jgi:hypothetical protein
VKPWIVPLKMGVVLPFYSSRVDFRLLSGVAPTMSYARSRVAVPQVWHHVLSVRHTGSCSYSDIDVVVLVGSR